MMGTMPTTSASSVGRTPEGCVQQTGQDRVRYFSVASGKPSQGCVAAGNQGASCSPQPRSLGLPLNPLECGFQEGAVSGKVRTMAPFPRREVDTGLTRVRVSLTSRQGSHELQTAIAAGTAQSEETVPYSDNRGHSDTPSVDAAPWRHGPSALAPGDSCLCLHHP